MPKADLLPAAVHECAVGIFVWSTVMAYNGDKLKTPPTSWADFWDTKKIPGKRGMRKGARYNLEFALLADGVKPADVYKVLATKDGADRAFKKLTELKPNIQWPGGIYDLDYWAIPKGTPNKDATVKFIAFTMQTPQQAAYAQNIAYGPANSKALASLDKKVLDDLPTSATNAKEALQFNVGFWADQGEALEKRFAAWATQ